MGNIAIVPARSGSKGLTDKNIMKLNGKPLMYYTIRAAIDSGCFDEVMVSTDSEKYADIARKCGASVPFLRSEEMSSDSANSWDAVREVLSCYAKVGKRFRYVALLQPTSPLRNANIIIDTFEKLRASGANNAVAITEVEHPVQWCFRLPDTEMLDEMAVSPYIYMRRQELEPYYRENGAIYIVDAEKIVNPLYNFYADKCVGYVMPREKSVDIDSNIDLMIAAQYL